MVPKRAISKSCPLGRIREKRLALRATNGNSQSWGSISICHLYNLYVYPPFWSTNSLSGGCRPCSSMQSCVLGSCQNHHPGITGWHEIWQLHKIKLAMTDSQQYLKPLWLPYRFYQLIIYLAAAGHTVDVDISGGLHMQPCILGSWCQNCHPGIIAYMKLVHLHIAQLARIDS